MADAMKQTENVPALVPGSGITALGVIRCLGRAGIPVFCASRELGFVAASRWCRKTRLRLARFADLGPFLQQLPFDRAAVFGSWPHAEQAVHHHDDPLPAIVDSAAHVGERFRDSLMLGR